MGPMGLASLGSRLYWAVMPMKGYPTNPKGFCPFEPSADEIFLSNIFKSILAAADVCFWS